MKYYSAIKQNEIMLFAEKMDETGSHHVKQNKPDLQRQIPHVFSHM
jgi:hypothetical protein